MDLKSRSADVLALHDQDAVNTCRDICRAVAGPPALIVHAKPTGNVRVQILDSEIVGTPAKNGRLTDHRTANAYRIRFDPSSIRPGVGSFQDATRHTLRVTCQINHEIAVAQDFSDWLERPFTCGLFWKVVWVDCRP
jgi:hypothetical protein